MADLGNGCIAWRCEREKIPFRASPRAGQSRGEVNGVELFICCSEQPDADSVSGELETRRSRSVLRLKGIAVEIACCLFLLRSLLGGLLGNLSLGDLLDSFLSGFLCSFLRSHIAS